jgi:hypothetical protein
MHQDVQSIELAVVFAVFSSVDTTLYHAYWTEISPQTQFHLSGPKLENEL